MDKRHAAAAILIALGFCSLLFPQSIRAELFGIVRDPQGLPVAGADVEIRNADTSVTQRTTSDTAGIYRFVALLPGNYELAVRKDTLSWSRTGLTFRVGDNVALDVPLSIGGVSQSIDVTATPGLLQTARGTVSFTVNRDQIAALPIDGRNFVPLIALSPGVMLPPASTLPRINGSRPRTSEYIYDGISVLQPEPGQVAYFPVPDAIEEFRVETNSYSAEYGRSNGGVIMVNHKSGTNTFHGNVFEFFRNEALNARNLFTPTGPKPRFRRNQYGFVLGGPIEPDKTFFFADYQGTRLQTGVVRTSTVPTSLQRQGIFAGPVFDPATTTVANGVYSRTAFSNNQIPQDRWDAAGAALLARYPRPNVFTPSGAEATANNYVRVANEETNQDQFGVRIDRVLNASQRLFGRYEYLHDHSIPSTPFVSGDGNITSGIIGDTRTDAHSLALDHTWMISPRQVNQLRFGYTRRGFGRESLRGDLTASAASGIPNIPVSTYANTFPSIDVVGFQQLGPTSSGNADFSTSVTQFVDNLSWFRGRHSMKMGTDIRIEHLDVLQPSNPTGLFQFTNTLTAGLSASGTPVANTGNSVASLLLGRVQTFSIDIQPDVIKPRATIAEFFFQDDLRATNRLSLNLGLRYTLNFPSTVVDDRGAVFNLDTQKLDFLGQNGYPRSARNLEKTNFAPRVGFAFHVRENSVVRSGYGLTWIEQAGITTPFTTPLFPFIQTAGQRSPDNINPAFVLSQGPSTQVQPPGPDSGLGQGVFSVNRKQKSGYAQQWNLSLQQTIGGTWSVEIGYLGSKLTNLGVPDVNLNQLTPEQLAVGSQLTQSVPNPFFGQIPASSTVGGPTITQQQLLRPYPRFTTVALYRNNVGHSTYHSFQSRVEKRLSRGVTFNASYTFSKLIDDAGAVFDSAILTGPAATFQVADSTNRRLEKDESTGSIPHVLSGSFVWNMPFYGLQLAGLFRAQSGSPLAVTQATNFNAFAGFGIQRPYRVSDPELPADERSTARWFNTSAFVGAPQFFLGNTSRNPVVGPGYRSLDVMLGKTFQLRDALRLELRAEAFNVTNSPSLGAPNTSFAPSPSPFGTITRAFDPRVFELVGKVSF
jgi:Carboxypeptidase regulatory-like domain